MRTMSIASGSSGNSIYMGTDNTHLLVDTGVSKKKIEEGLKKLELSGTDINGILLTHEHTDHIGGLGVFLRKYPVPVYGTKGTIEATLRYSKLGAVDPELFIPIEYDEVFTIGDIDIKPVKICHDAAQPSAFRFESGDKKSAVMTDLGCYNDYIVDAIKGLDTVYIEANHDIRMLELGPYSYDLKRRILSSYGHLSNEMSGKLLDSILHDGIKHIVLSHLSKENNLPELAFETVRSEVNMSESKYCMDDFHLMVAKRECPSEILCF
ncbi:MAG: MBL fold metallo-hydrolase [Lachnospiraceae bacterium]|nr:MBL fold metallo-hydrolase [Lachnospiraceae bacterium]